MMGNYLVSIREKFTDADNVGGVLGYAPIDFNNYDSEQLKNDFINNMPDLKGDILLLVHGYNNDFSSVLRSYKTIVNKVNNLLPGKYSNIIGFVWPGGDAGVEWYSAVRNANDSSSYFCQLLTIIKNKIGSGKIDIMSHSLGARVVLKGLNPLGATSAQLINDYFCMAAAVDNESLENHKEFEASIKALNKILVFYSCKDEVLAFAYRPAEMDNALGLTGPEDSDLFGNNPKVFVVNCKNKVKCHSGYKDNDAVYAYISTFNGVNKYKLL